MKTLLVNLSEDTHLWLETFPNKSQIVRDALILYREHITTERETLQSISDKLDTIVATLESFR